YAPKDNDINCCPGEVGFQGLSLDVYLPPSSPFIIRALGYEQDDMDPLFAIHRYSLASYFFPFRATGYADAFSTLDARIAFQSDAFTLSYFKGNGNHLKAETLSDSAFPAAFRVDGLKLKTADYDLYFPLEGLPLTAAEINDPPVAEANGPYTV